MLIIGLGHRQKVGKDLAAKILMGIFRVNYNYSIQRKSFAAKLKDVCHGLYGWAGLMSGPYYDTHPELKDVLLPKIGMTPRQIWIKFANKVRETFPDTWVDYVLNESFLNNDILLITDLRYPNEVLRIREKGGFVVKINRPDQPKSDDEADSALETFTDWDLIINNDSCLTTYSKKLNYLKDIILGKVQNNLQIFDKEI